MLSKNVKKRLAKKLEANLPDRLTDKEALWWIQHADYLAGVLSALADVVVPKD